MAGQPTSRNEIVGIADSGLLLQIDGRQEVAPWSTISTVNAVLALIDRTSDQRIPVLVFEIVVGADERTFIVGESEPQWDPLASTLSDYLPGMPSFDIWGAELAASGMALLYERTGGLQ